MRYSISNAIPHNPKSKNHPYENLVNMGLSAFSCQGTDSPKRSKRKTNIFMHGGYLDTTFR